MKTRNSLTALACLGLSLAAASAQTWNVSTGGNWDTATNWNPNTVPNAIGATATIQNLTSSGTYDISAASPQSFTIGTLNFGTNSVANAINLSLNSDVSLVMDVVSGNAAINLGTAGSGSSMTINSAIQLNDNTTVSLSRNGSTTIVPTFAGNINLQSNTLTFGATRQANINVNGLVSGTGAIAFSDAFADRRVQLSNTGSTFSGGVTISGSNALVLGNGTGDITGTGGGGIAGTGTLTFSNTSRGTPLGSARSPQIYFNGSTGTAALANNTTGNVVANNISIASGNHGIFTVNRDANLTGNISGGGTLFQIVGDGGTGSARTLALNSSQTSFTGTYVLREGQLVTRGNNFGPGSVLQINSANTAGGTALGGMTGASGTATLSSALDVVNNGNNVFIQTGGGTTFQLTGNFSNSAASPVGFTTTSTGNQSVLNGVDTTNLRVGMGVTGTNVAANTTITGIGANSISLSTATTGTPSGLTQSAGAAGTITFTRGQGTAATGYNIGTNTGTAAFELSGTGSLNNPIAIVNSSATTAALRFTNTSGTQTFSGVVSGNGTLTRNGAGGTTVLSGNNVYSGSTTITAGTLLINGSHTGGGAYSVSGILGGSGTITPASGSSFTVNSGGIIAPGATAATISTLTFDSAARTGALASFSTGAKFAFDLNATALSSDLIQLNNGAAGDLVFNGNVIDFNLLNGSLATGQVYTLFSATAANNYSGLALDASNKITSGLSIGSGLTGYSESYLTLNGSDIQLTVVPEPATWVLFAASFTVLVVFRRRRTA